MSSATQIYNNLLNQAVKSGELTRDQAEKKKSNIIVLFILWIAESSPMITAFTAICYSMSYFICLDPLDILNSSIIKLILNIIIIYSAFVTIIRTLFTDVFISCIKGIIDFY
jgi:hypothetical protein